MKKTLKTSDFNYELPEEQIASKPADQRDQSRLLVLDRSSGVLDDRIFHELPELLQQGDLLVVNNTRVIPARFESYRQTGGKIEGLFLNEPSAGIWEVMLKNAGRCKPGERILLGEEFELEITENLGNGHWHVKPCTPADANEILEKYGSTPLPPKHSNKPCRVLKKLKRVYQEKPGRK